MIGFIGGGNMGEAILKGLIKGGVYQPSEISVFDVNAGRLKFLKETYGINSANSGEDIVKRSNVVIIAVKPQIIDSVLLGLKKYFITDNRLIISIAAGVTIAQLEDNLGGNCKIVRVMPNAAAFVLESMSAISFNERVDTKDKEIVFKIFNAIGKTVELDERYMDAVTALSGSGPGFFSLILEAFSDAGVNVGLPRDIADKLILQTIKGTLKLSTDSGKSFVDIKNMVTSPGGTTIKGIHALEQGGIKSAIMNCVEAAFLRSNALK